MPNIRTDSGHLHVALCPRALFLEDNCPYKAIVPAHKGETVAHVHHVPEGTYAAQLFLDENDNDELDRNWLGVPEEGVGFSRDPSYTFSPPDFEDTSFDFDGSSKTIRLRLKYY